MWKCVSYSFPVRNLRVKSSTDLTHRVSVPGGPRGFCIDFAFFVLPFWGKGAKAQGVSLTIQMLMGADWYRLCSLSLYPC